MSLRRLAWIPSSLARRPRFARRCEASTPSPTRVGPATATSSSTTSASAAAGATFFDADEAHAGWFAGDVAMAVRDLTGGTLDSVPRPSLLDAFLTGYRSQRAFTAEEERSLPLHSAAASLRLAVDVDAALADGSESAMPDLREHLVDHREWHRRKVLEWSGRRAL